MGDSESGQPTRSPFRDWLSHLIGDARATEPSIPERRVDERRSHSAWSFAYGSFRPRRRVGRRDHDHDRIFLDWHEPRVLYLALSIVLMCCADALFTLNLMAIGAEEVNALMDNLIAHDVERFLAIKIGVTGGSVILLGVAARRRFLGIIPVYRVLQLFCAGYVVLLLWELWLFAVYATGLPFHWQPWSN